MFDWLKKKKAPEPVPAPAPTSAADAAPEPAADSKATASAPPTEMEAMEAVNKAVKDAFRSGDKDVVVAALKQAYEDHKDLEGPAGWVAGVIGEKGVVPLFGLLEDFVGRYPDSLYSVRVLWADFLASRERFDEAAEHARAYIRLAKDAGKFDQLGSLRIIKDGVSRAFAILFVPYAMLGAKSYAKRVLEYACGLDLDPSWKVQYKESLAQLDADLSDPDSREQDARWEAFFASASHVTELFKFCESAGFPKLARRVDLIEGFFRTTPGFKADEREMFRIVREFSMPDGSIAHGLI